MNLEKNVPRMAALLKQLRLDRNISRRQLADQSGVNPSVVSRVERGVDAQLSTWERLFEGLGYQLLLDVTELAEEMGDLMDEEANRRRERRREGLCAGKRRFF